MKTLVNYIDDAKRELGVHSDRAVSKKIGSSAGQLVHLYRKGVMFPSEKTMILLAKLGNNDPFEAICALHEWRADNETAPMWHEIVGFVQEGRRRAAA